SELEQLPLAEREGRRPSAGVVRQTELLQQLQGTVLVAARDRAPHERVPRLLDRDDEILDERQLREDARVLKGARQPGSGGTRRLGSLHGAPREGNGSRIRPQVAREQVEDRRLARAVRADERRDRPFRDGEAAVRDGGDAAEPLRQSARLQQAHERRSVGTMPCGRSSRTTTKTSEYAIR